MFTPEKYSFEWPYDLHDEKETVPSAEGMELNDGMMHLQIVSLPGLTPRNTRRQSRNCEENHKIGKEERQKRGDLLRHRHRHICLDFGEI